MAENIMFLIPALFVISLVYTSVGLGGGSSYVALLFLLGMPLASIPPVALFFNITASSVAFYRFSKRGYVVPRQVYPFLLTSVPATFLGASLKLNENILSLVFALILFSIALVLLFRKKEIKSRFSVSSNLHWILPSLLGAILGFLAGLVGIGGGIFLGPVLLLIGYSSPKYIAGICSAFVLINSIVGLTVRYMQGGVDISAILLLGLVVFAGAQFGSFFGTKKISPIFVQKIVAVILMIVSFKLGLGALS